MKHNVLKSLVYFAITLLLDGIFLLLMKNRGDAFITCVAILNGVMAVTVLAVLLKDFEGHKQYREFFAFVYYILATILNFAFIIFKLNNITVAIAVNVIILALFLIFYLLTMAKVNKDGTDKMF